MAPNDEQFAEAAKHWDLETLYTDLASAKSKRLTPMEKLHLRGLLCGCSPTEIAERLGKNVKGVETDLCATLYRYVKSLVGKSNGKVDNWRNITEWLEGAGYQTPTPTEFPDDQGLSDKVNITNITFHDNEITIGVYLQITVPLSSEVSAQNLDFENESVS